MPGFVVQRGTMLYYRRKRNVRTWGRFTLNLATYLATSSAEWKWRKVSLLSLVLLRRRNLRTAIEQSFESDEEDQEGLPIIELLRQEQLQRLEQQEPRRRAVCA